MEPNIKYTFSEIKNNFSKAHQDIIYNLCSVNIGKMYGRLRVEKLSYVIYKRFRYPVIYKYFSCICSCGNRKDIELSSLRKKGTLSCGCLLKEITRKRRLLYLDRNIVNSPEYRAWKGMKTRCSSNHPSYFKYYKGIGVKVCDRWQESFNNFLKDMGKRPSEFHSLDRYPNKYGDYSPDNCRWATQLQQVNNQRSNISIKHNGETKNISEWACTFGINYNTLIQRYWRGLRGNKLFSTTPLPYGTNKKADYKKEQLHITETICREELN